jgi:hypothetical protein
MAPSDGSSAVATLSLLALVAFQLVGGYATFKIIQNRQCLHIVNVSTHTCAIRTGD